MNPNRVFLAGATGAIGQRLVPILVAAGHSVVGTTRSPAKLTILREWGAEGVVADALDRDAIIRAVEQARPDVVVHELTSIPRGKINFRRFDAVFAPTNRLRIEGTDNLREAAARAHVPRLIAQSFAGWPFAATGTAVKTEDDPLETHPPDSLKRSLAAIRHLEERVTHADGIEGIVLRYGLLYGPRPIVGESVMPMIVAARKRQLPIVGSGAGVWSFVHVDDAAAATALAIERAAPGIYNIVDDDPVRTDVLFPELARIAGGKPPWHVPVWMAKLLVGSAGVHFMAEMRGASNKKAKALLGWTPKWPSWREGFRSLVTDSEP